MNCIVLIREKLPIVSRIPLCAMIYSDVDSPLCAACHVTLVDQRTICERAAEVCQVKILIKNKLIGGVDMSDLLLVFG